jgi:cytochrome c biogenesis protein CcdA
VNLSTIHTLLHVLCFLLFKTMWLLALSFFAWVLTIIAPCVLPILPIILGWSVINGQKSRPWVIILAFAVSILVFTLTLQFLVTQFGLQVSTLSKISAWILILMWLLFLFPSAWQWVMEKTWLENATNKMSSGSHSWLIGDITTGAILWPLFNTCSPTFLILVSNILPESFARGVVNILVYILGLSIMLALILYWGRAAIKKLKWFANPNGIFKKVLAVLLILVWVAIIFQFDKKAEIFLIENGLTIDTTSFEYDLVKEYK